MTKTLSARTRADQLRAACPGSKIDDEIDGLERRQHFGARVHLLHRPPSPFKRRSRSVAVEADDEPVAGGARLGQELDVAGVQEIEAAIGEADAQTPLRQSASRSSSTDQSNTIFSSGASEAAGRMRERSSAAETVAVPRLPTTTAAAALAARTAASIVDLASRASPRATATTVSPAPDTSRTLDRIGRHVERRTVCRHQDQAGVAERHDHRVRSQHADSIPTAAAITSSSESARRRVASASSLRFGLITVAPR